MAIRKKKKSGRISEAKKWKSRFFRAVRHNTQLSSFIEDKNTELLEKRSEIRCLSSVIHELQTQVQEKDKQLTHLQSCVDFYRAENNRLAVTSNQRYQEMQDFKVRLQNYKTVVDGLKSTPLISLAYEVNPEGSC